MRLSKNRDCESIFILSLFFSFLFFLQPRWKQSYQFRMKFLAKIKALLFYKTMTPINFLMVVVSCWNIVRSKMKKKSRNLPIWKEKQNYQLLFYFHYSTFLRNFIFFSSSHSSLFSNAFKYSNWREKKTYLCYWQEAFSTWNNEFLLPLTTFLRVNNHSYFPPIWSVSALQKKKKKNSLFHFFQAILRTVAGALSATLAYWPYWDVAFTPVWNFLHKKEKKIRQTIVVLLWQKSGVINQVYARVFKPRWRTANIRTYSQQLVMTNAHAKTGCDKFACWLGWEDIHGGTFFGLACS